MKILVIGVGGGGNNMIDYLSKNSFKEIIYYKINTDAQALKGNRRIKTMQLGTGLGAGMKPEVGLKAAMDSKEDLEKICRGKDLIFISAGMGGGTGTGASPYVAKIAKESGALTIAVVTEPFKFEGNKRKKIALNGISELEKNCDSTIIVENDSLLKIIDRSIGLKDSFKKVDEVLATAVNGISGVIISKGNNDINLDFADLNTIFNHDGGSIIGIGESKESADDAINKALNSPLLKNQKIETAQGVMIHFEIHSNFPFFDLGSAIENLSNNFNEDIEIIFGTTTNDKLDNNEVIVTMIAAGIEVEAITIKEESRSKVFRIDGIDYSGKRKIKVS